ncbi:SAM-dependent methyltransferase [Actinoplanes sp. ATCC 53533]|uniref:class I SAM-dependent methyltransferase n=1 Tax=Actinoplanes sp. ATCC 53533 TaxID=1288362 RepID=UPI000F76BC08|nr:class I SAM-dependent methyltransferase [Actinoplanes sp. ATCC 53533]RSM43717.1 SAM-dependent methyltransferase [Actinoplanes sp. ATCC 53533]
MPNHAHAQPAHGHQHGHRDDDTALAELVDLDAEVLSAHLGAVMGLLHSAADGPVRHIVDLGSGTGTGAFALLRRFAGAEVVAVDAAATMLDRVRAKAADLGLRDAVRTVRADLDESWPALGPADLVWAAASLHHMADPDRVLAGVFGTIRPGGLLAVAELDSFPRFLSGDLGDGLEARCHAVLAEARARDLPHIGDDWAARVRRAGFAVEQDRTFTIDLVPPLPAATGRYARACLLRARTGLQGRISDADLAALDALLDDDGPESIVRRDDLRVRTTRTLLLARRP